MSVQQQQTAQQWQAPGWRCWHWWRELQQRAPQPRCLAADEQGFGLSLLLALSTAVTVLLLSGQLGQTARSLRWHRGQKPATDPEPRSRVALLLSACHRSKALLLRPPSVLHTVDAGACSSCTALASNLLNPQQTLGRALPERKQDCGTHWLSWLCTQASSPARATPRADTRAATWTLPRTRRSSCATRCDP